MQFTPHFATGFPAFLPFILVFLHILPLFVMFPLPFEENLNFLYGGNRVLMRFWMEITDH